MTYSVKTLCHTEPKAKYLKTDNLNILYTFAIYIYNLDFSPLKKGSKLLPHKIFG